MWFIQSPGGLFSTVLMLSFWISSLMSKATCVAHPPLSPTGFHASGFLHIYSLVFDSHQKHGCFPTFLLFKVSNLAWLSVRPLCSLYLIVGGWEKNDFLVCQLCHYHKYAANQGSVPETSYSIRLLTALRSDALWGLPRGGGGSATNTAISWTSSNMCHGFSH